MKGSGFGFTSRVKGPRFRVKRLGSRIKMG